MDNADSYRIEPLTKKNYDSWKIKMKALLVKKGLWEYVSGDSPKPSAANNNNLEEWEKMDQKAKSELILSIDGSVLLLLKLQDNSTSHDIWKTIYTIFCLEDRSMKLYLLKQLISSTRMQEGDVRECLLEFYEMLDDLSEMGVKVDNSFLCTILLNILPPSFADFKKKIESDDKALVNIQHLGMEILKTLEKLENKSDKEISDTEGSPDAAENIVQVQNQKVQSQETIEKNSSLLEQQEHMIHLEKQIRDSFEQLIIGKILVDERRVSDFEEQIRPTTTKTDGYYDKPLEIKKVLGTIKACGICREQGHDRRTCPQNSPTKNETLPSRNIYTCGVCGKEGHNRRTCPLNIASVPATYSPIKITQSCGICGGAGHNRTTCPQNTPVVEAISSPRRAYTCGICGREGHNRRTCPLNTPLVAAAPSWSNTPVAEEISSPRRAYSCGICGREGHNRRTCPLNTPLVAAAPSWSNTPSYSSASSRSSSITAAPAMASPRRYTCGLCGGEGHNRRTCSMNY